MKLWHLLVEYAFGKKQQPHTQAHVHITDLNKYWSFVLVGEKSLAGTFCFLKIKSIGNV